MGLKRNIRRQMAGKGKGKPVGRGSLNVSRPQVQQTHLEQTVESMPNGRKRYTSKRVEGPMPKAILDPNGPILMPESIADDGSIAVEREVTA